MAYGRWFMSDDMAYGEKTNDLALADFGLLSKEYRVAIRSQMFQTVN